MNFSYNDIIKITQVLNDGIKVKNPNKNKITFFISSNSISNFSLNVNPNFSGISIELPEKKEQNIITSFLVTLRKYTERAVINNVRLLNNTSENDRIIVFELSNSLKIVFEINRFLSNIFLVNKDFEIMSFFKKPISKERILNIGQIYKTPFSKAPILKDKLEKRVINPLEEMSQLILKLEKKEILNTHKKELLNPLRTVLKKERKTLLKREKELFRSKEAIKYKNFGELLKYNLHLIKKGQINIKLFDWVTNEEVKIPLKPELSPKENMKLYFKKYKKFNNSVELIANLISKSRKNLKIYENLIQEIELEEDLTLLSNFKEKLYKHGILKKKIETPKVIKEKKQDFLVYISEDGFTIFVGKNRQGNHKLTFKVAKGNDFWFHAKDYSGSHVVISAPKNTEVPYSSKINAAALALNYSSNKSEQGDITHTQVKFLKSVKGEIGKVIISNPKTIFIKNKSEILSKIQKAEIKGP